MRLPQIPSIGAAGVGVWLKQSQEKRSRAKQRSKNMLALLKQVSSILDLQKKGKQRRITWTPCRSLSDPSVPNPP